MSNAVDWKVELVVIGKTGKYIKTENAMVRVFGYMVGNDISMRDWQIPRDSQLGPQWIWGKSMDTAALTGPYVVTKDELPNPHNVTLKLRVNGQLEQVGNTKDLIHKIPHLIH